MGTTKIVEQEHGMIDGNTLFLSQSLVDFPSHSDCSRAPATSKRYTQCADTARRDDDEVECIAGALGGRRS